MTDKSFNPLTDAVAVKSRQSLDLAPDIEPVAELDTHTPAVAPKEPRRFTLGDLPRYADALYPRLKQLFPHINDRMYGGWIRGCINDNACLFICIDADSDGGAAAMAFIAHEPLNPVPYIDTLFVIGAPDIRVSIYERIVKWAKETGASEIRVRQEPSDKILARVKGSKMTERKSYVLELE